MNKPDTTAPEIHTADIMNYAASLTSQADADQFFVELVDRAQRRNPDHSRDECIEAVRWNLLYHATERPVEECRHIGDLFGIDDDLAA